MNKALMTFLLGVLLCSVSHGEKAEWIEALRPTKVYMDLNGTWSCHDFKETPYFQLPLPKEGWYDVKVPVDNLNSPECAYRWWLRKFTLSKEVREALRKGDRAILHLGGRTFRWQLLVNGKKIIDSMDAFNPFNIDVTSEINLDGENSILIGTTALPGICKDNNPKMALAPKGGVSDGNVIWSDVELWVRPKNRISDVFIKPSWREKKLELDIESLGPNTDLKITGTVFDKEGSAVLDIPKSNITEKQKDKSLYKIKLPWQNPIPWNVDKPYLYSLELVLEDADGKKCDKRRIDFGFRELWIDGKNLMMNDRRLFLARKSIWPELVGPEKLKKIVVAHAKQPGINSLRMHRGTYYNLAGLAWLADRHGLFLLPEYLANPGHYDILNPELWRNYYKFVKRLIRSTRNHPSIVSWDLCNEFLWCEYKRLDKKDLLKLSNSLYGAAKVAENFDPTRPVQFDGDWDLPPESKNKTVNLHYPFPPTKNRYPTECWKFLNPKKPFRIQGLTGEFTWFGDKEKPIFVGEYIWMWNRGNRPWADSMYAGDKVFEWKFWKSRKVFNQNLRWLTDVWRVCRFAGLNPWSHSPSHFKYLMPYELVILRDQFRTFFSGENISLNGWVLNDTATDYSYKLRWSILKEGKSLFSKTKDLQLQAGGIAPLTMDIQMPVVNFSEDMLLKIEMIRGDKKCFNESQSIRIHPKAPLAWPKSLALIDPVGKSTLLFKKLGLQPILISSAKELEGKSAVIIGQDSLIKLAPELRERAIPDFVKKGGNALCLRQKTWPNNGFGLPEVHSSPNHSRSNFAWVRAQKHPVLKNLKDIDLGMWRKGDWVCDNAIKKPVIHNGVAWRPLLDIGTSGGLNYCPLMEVFKGAGRYLLCTMNMEKAEYEPAARKLLSNLISDLSRPAPTRVNCAFIGEDDSEIAGLISRMGVELNAKSHDGATVVIVDANSPKASPDTLKKIADKGATIWLFDLNPSNVEKWSGVIPGGMKLEPGKSISSCMINNSDTNALTQGLSNQEFFWNAGCWTEGFRQFRKSEDDIHGVFPVANIADNVITAPKGINLVNPSAMVEVPEGKGRWLLSTVNFHDGLVEMPIASYWIVQNILNNLNVKFSDSKVKRPSNFKMLSLKKFANRGFQDDVAADGKGGWSDQGKNYDFRFFPVNLSGFNSVGEPELPPEKFPEIMTFYGIPFEIIDPRKNNNKSMIVLEPRAELLSESIPHDCIRQVEIPVNRRFDRFYALHTSAWTNPTDALWKYIIHYEDGSKAEFPVRSRKEISDWHNPKSTRRANIAWRGEALKFKDVGIYICPFENPQPSKKVKSLEIISGLKSYGGVFAITIADIQNN